MLTFKYLFRDTKNGCENTSREHEQPGVYFHEDGIHATACHEVESREQSNVAGHLLQNGSPNTEVGHQATAHPSSPHNEHQQLLG
jgi:hypothetical protein